MNAKPISLMARMKPFQFLFFPLQSLTYLTYLQFQISEIILNFLHKLSPTNYNGDGFYMACVAKVAKEK